MSSEDKPTNSGGDSHRLMSKNHGESPIEVLATRLESRKENRVPVPFHIKKDIEHACHAIAKKEGYADSGRIHYEDLVHLREKTEAEHAHTNPVLLVLGFHDDRELKLEILDRAEQVVSESHEKEMGWFYYKDFMVSRCSGTARVFLRWYLCGSFLVGQRTLTLVGHPSFLLLAIT